MVTEINWAAVQVYQAARDEAYFIPSDLETFDSCWIPASFEKWRKEQTQLLQLRTWTAGIWLACLRLLCQFSAAFSCHLAFCAARDQCENTPGRWTCAVGHHEGLEPSQHRHSSWPKSWTNGGIGQQGQDESCVRFVSPSYSQGFYVFGIRVSWLGSKTVRFLKTIFAECWTREG